MVDSYSMLATGDRLKVLVVNDNKAVVFVVVRDERGIVVSERNGATEEIQMPFDHGFKVFGGCAQAEVAEAGWADEFWFGSHCHGGGDLYRVPLIAKILCVHPKAKILFIYTLST